MASFFCSVHNLEWSTQWWAILLPLKSFYKQLGIVTPFVPFIIHSESLAVKENIHFFFFFLILCCLIMSRDSDWYFSSVFRLMFPACWSVHDLNSLVSSSARVACCLLISLYFFSLHFSRQVNIWYSSSSLLIHIFVTQHIWQQNNFCWIYSLVGYCLRLVESCEWMLKACFVLRW